MRTQEPLTSGFKNILTSRDFFHDFALAVINISSLAETGILTTITQHPDGRITVARTDANGNPVGQGRDIDDREGEVIVARDRGNAAVSMAAGRGFAKDRRRPKKVRHAKLSKLPSEIYYNPETGVTTKIVKNADGSYAITQANSGEKIISQWATTDEPELVSFYDSKRKATVTMVARPDGTYIIIGIG